MAAPTDAELVNGLITKLGDTPDGVLAGRIWGLWATTAYQNLTGVRRAVAVANDALIALLGDLTHQARAAQTDKDRVPALTLERQLRIDQQQLLVALEAQLPVATGSAVSGQLSTVAPWDAPAWGPNANDTRYGGDPYRRGWGRYP